MRSSIGTADWPNAPARGDSIAILKRAVTRHPLTPKTFSRQFLPNRKAVFVRQHVNLIHPCNDIGLRPIPLVLSAQQCVRCERALSQTQKSSTRSRTWTRNALAILTSELTEGDSLPHSTRLMKTVDRSAFSASLSWLSLACLRLERMASPNRRRCFGMDGMNVHNNKR